MTISLGNRYPSLSELLQRATRAGTHRRGLPDEADDDLAEMTAEVRAYRDRLARHLGREAG